MGARRQLTMMLLVPASAAALVLLQPCAPPLPVDMPSELQAPGDGATTGMPQLAPVRTAVEPPAIAARTRAAATDVASLLASLLEADGSAAKTALLRRAASRRDTPDVELLVGVVREARCSEGAGAGDTPAEYALQQLLRASRMDAAARAALGALAFDALCVPAIHRERAARAYAGSATAREALWLRARAESASDPVLREALLAGLGECSGPPTGQ